MKDKLETHLISDSLLQRLVLMFIAFLVSGCAVTQTKLSDSNDQGAVKLPGHPVAECSSTQRDLSVLWQLRQYWCGQKDSKDRLQLVNDATVQIAKVNQAYLAAINAEAEEQSIPGKKLHQQNKRQKIKVIDVIEPENDATNQDLKPQTKSEKSTERSTVTARIIFAKHLKVLGPQGRGQTSAMAQQVSKSKKVRIRGLILPDEVLVDSTLYREKVSVGRALAVRKHWKEQGIDTSHVKILHHKSDLPGRIVEVYFNG